MKSSFGIYSKSNNLTNKEGNAIIKSKRFNSTCQCAHQTQFRNRAQEHKWEGFSWPLLRNAVEREGRPKGEGLLPPIWDGNIFYTTMNLSWGNTVTGYIQNWKEKSPILTSVFMESLFEHSLSFKAYPSCFIITLICFLTCIRKVTGLTQEI